MPSWIDTLIVDLHELELMARLGFRLLASMILAAMIGFEREASGRSAGLRTHMLVALGAAVFTSIVVETEGQLADVVRGVAAGVGFLGAGVIIKTAQPAEIHGLTTAASIWLTASVGFAAGAGWIVTATMATLLALFILAIVRIFEKYLDREDKANVDDVSVD